MVKVSVIIPAYNSENFIEETVYSVLNQDFKDYELIIVNDCSSDNTKEIIEKMIQENPNKKIRLINHRKNKLRSGALNTGIKNSKGEYIVFLDADDLMLKKRLKRQSYFLEKNKDVSLVYGDLEILEDGEEKELKAVEFKEKPREILIKSSKRNDLGKIWPFKFLDKERFIPSCSVMIKRNVFNKIKLDENLRNSEDYDLWFQIIGAGFKIKKLSIPTYIYRKHKNQKSNNKKKMLIAAKYINKKLKSGIYFKNLSSILLKEVKKNGR